MDFQSSLMLIVVSSLASLSGISGQDAFPNIGYLGRGYDIFKGNPDATNVNTDPGFRSAIYNLQYDSELTPDRRYVIPNGVESFTTMVCDVNFRSMTIENTKSYYDLLRKQVSFSEGGEFDDFSGSFSGSEDYKRIEETTWNSEEIYTISYAKCSKYSANILAYLPPQLTRNFFSGMMYILPVSYDKTKYMKFLSNLTTHVVEGVVMGAKYGELSEMTRNEYEKLVTTQTKVEDSSKFSAFITSGSSSLTETERREGEKFKKVTKNQRIFSFGAKPPTDGSEVTWANSVFNNPMPLSYTLKPIYEVLTEKYILETPSLKTKRDSLRRAVQEYCLFLKEKGEVKECAPPRTPPPTPPPETNTCRLCTSCAQSGDYSNEGGRLIHKGDWGPYDMYESGCQGRFTRSWGEPRLCCTGKSPACNFCLSCGADWPYEVGRKLNSGDWGPWITYGGQCKGSYRETWDSFALCCKNLDTCRMCTSCGERMTEIGRVVHKGDWGDWRTFDAANCVPGSSGGYHTPDIRKVEPIFCCRKVG